MSAKKSKVKPKKCPPGKIFVAHQCRQGIMTKDWIVVKGGSAILILKKEGDVGDIENVLELHRGSLEDTESDWQPASIQISQDEMRRMVESNISIFYDEKDLKRRKWKNRGLIFAG